MQCSPTRLGARDDLHGEDAVAAQFEERVVDAHALDPEHLGEDVCEHLLDRIGGCTVRLGRVLGGRQGARVELAVDGERQRLDADHRGGHQVPGQPLGERRPGSHGIHRTHDVTDQPLVAGPILTDHDHGLRHAVHLGERRLNLPQLDAVATDLDLVVGPPQVLQLAVRAPSDQIAGAVHPRALPPERTRHEPRPGQSWPAPIPHAHTAARDVQLAHNALRDGTQEGVQDEEGVGGHRRANRDRARRATGR